MSRRQFIDLLPVFSSVLIESGNAGQLWRMWTRHTAAGQNPWSWLSILVALTLWAIYHRHNKATVAFWVTIVSCVVILAIIVTVLVV